jgi:glycosyltransferase involved in cell wall biosynthesis
MPDRKRPALLILGIRGIPAAHGGFETFAEYFALYMNAKGWDVTVYCQEDVEKKSKMPLRIDSWRGIRRVHIQNDIRNAAGTMAFDWASIRHAMREPGLPLILGYNTALFMVSLRLFGRPVLMNMDGIEWKRAKWSWPAKLWLYINEQIGARFSSRLIADHPAIADHLAAIRRRADIVTIPYGAERLEAVPETPVWEMGLVPRRYFLSVGRIEPENSLLEMIAAYAERQRDEQFVCLGRLDPSHSPYHRAVIAAAKGRVLFTGPIYDKTTVQALRYHALAYCHGHTVGGTNPSLVEALGAGSPVIARDNVFNRWVAGGDQLYFRDRSDCAAAFDRAGTDTQWQLAASAAARRRFDEQFTWASVLQDYEQLCGEYV